MYHILKLMKQSHKSSPGLVSTTLPLTRDHFSSNMIHPVFKIIAPHVEKLSGYQKGRDPLFPTSKGPIPMPLYVPISMLSTNSAILNQRIDDR